MQIQSQGPLRPSDRSKIAYLPDASHVPLGFVAKGVHYAKYYDFAYHVLNSPLHLTRLCARSTMEFVHFAQTVKTSPADGLCCALCQQPRVPSLFEMLALRGHVRPQDWLADRVRAKNRKHVCTPTADRTRPHEWRLNEHGNYTWSLVKQPAAPGSSGIKRHRDSELDELASDESSDGPPESAPDSAASAAKKPRTSLERLVDSLSLRKMGVVRREDGALVLKCPNSCCTQQVASSSALCCRSSSGWGTVHLGGRLFRVRCSARVLAALAHGSAASAAAAAAGRQCAAGFVVVVSL